MSDDAIVNAALTLAPISVGEDFEGYRRIQYPFDTEADARSFCYGHPQHVPPIPPQFGCGLFGAACLRAGEVDGTITWHGRRVDFLREPYKRFSGMIVVLLEELGHQRGLLGRGTSLERPELLPGTILCVGGDDGLPRERWAWGGAAHVVVVTGLWPDGTLETVEGGQIDPGNGHHGTAVLLKHRTLYRRGRGAPTAPAAREAEQWWLREAGTGEAGRRVRWWFAAGALPCLEAA